jgi:preprotein translocase subunit SecD
VTVAVGMALTMLVAACSSGDDEVRTAESAPDDGIEAVFRYEGELEPAELEEAVTILRHRLDALALTDVAIDSEEPGVVRIRVGRGAGARDLPEAFELVGRSAELRFRPVLQVFGPAVPLGAGLVITDPADDLADTEVILEELDGDEVVGRYSLGPTELTGSIIESADAQLSPVGEWTVALVLEAGAGIDGFNALAATCAPPTAPCPTGQVAIVLDSVVMSAPTVQEPSFERDSIQISGTFSEQEAKDLALVLRYGSLPVALDLESVEQTAP